MRSRNAWLYSLGLAGVLAFGLTGCGGGDVPDPSADEAAATEEGGEAPTEPAAPAPAAETPSPAVAAPAAPAGPEAPGAPEAPAVAAGTPAPAAAAPQPDAPKSEPVPIGKSDTAEMLALATGAPPAPAGASAPAAAPGSAPGGLAPGPGVAPGAPGERDDPSLNPIAPGGPGGAAPPGEIPPPRDLGAGPAPGGAEGMGSDLAGGVGGNTPSEPGDTNSPHGAVKAFLYALEHKDRDRLAEATALRANSEEGGKYRELFSRIIDSSISDSELDDLSTKLQGFKDTGRSNQVKSTGREGVTIQKQLKDGTVLQRTVTVRREKKGWGVLDIGAQLKFDRPQMSKFPNRRR